MNFLKYILYITVFSTLCNASIGQTVIHPKVGVLSVHPFSEPNRKLFENTLDYNKQFLIEPMVMCAIETYFRGDIWAWQIMPGFYSDAVGKPAFFLNTGLKVKLFDSFKHSMHISGGVSLLGRHLWENVNGYVTQKTYSSNGLWEYRLEPFGELEYVYMISKKIDLTTSVAYGLEYQTFTVTLGTRIWLSTEIKNPVGCGTCPFQKSTKKYKRKKKRKSGSKNSKFKR